VAEAYPVLDALLQPQEFDMGEITHDGSPSAEKDCRASTPFSCGVCVVLPPAFLLRSAAVMTLSANDCRLSSSVENARSVRKNPKDSRLVKLRARKEFERQNVTFGFGPR
jgi:hypothetical protein